MRRILVPFDGSKAAQRAVQYVIKRIRRGEKLLADILYVQPFVVPSEYFSADDIARWQKAEEEKVFSKLPMEELGGDLSAKIHVQNGNIVEKIVKFAKKKRSQEIIMGTRGMSRLQGFFLGSVSTRVVRLSSVPVTLIK